jgi:hypothetical protein
VNNTLTSLFPKTSRQANSGQQPHVPQSFGRLGSNLSETMPDLTDREAEILNHIRKAAGGPVKFNLGDYTSACGLTISTLGFNGAGACGTRSPFMITHKMLSEMAADEVVYRERMAWIQEILHEQNTLEASLADGKRKAEQEDAERKAQQIRMRIMSATGFWDDNQREGLSTSQSGHLVQKMADSYEQMISVQ